MHFKSTLRMQLPPGDPLERRPFELKFQRFSFLSFLIQTTLPSSNRFPILSLSPLLKVVTHSQFKDPANSSSLFPPTSETVVLCRGSSPFYLFPRHLLSKQLSCLNNIYCLSAAPVPFIYKTFFFKCLFFR